MAYRIILASASPRRKELLEQVGAEFEIIPAVGEEIITDSSPQQAVLDLAAQKAAEVAAKVREDAIILGADTVVAFGDKILGKPKNEADAKQMLSLLSGKTHSVYTGVSIVVRQSGESQSYSFYEETEVTMYPLSEQQILSYIRTKEPMDKAGSYGIQGKGAVFIEKIQGDYNNVVGLPIARVFRTLEEVCGFSVMVREIYHLNFVRFILSYRGRDRRSDFMNGYDELCLEYFLENQSQLFDERVAENLDDAQEFLEDCMAVVCRNIKEVRAYFEEEGADISYMDDEELEEASEVFSLPDGRFLVVEV